MNQLEKEFINWLKKQPFFIRLRKLFGGKGKGSNKSFGKKPLTVWILALIAVYAFTIVTNFFRGTLVLDLSLNATGILTIFFMISILVGILKQYKPALFAAVGTVVLYLGLMAYSSPLFNYQAHRNLIGEIKEVAFSNQIDYMDLSQVPIIDEQLADKLADKKLGDIPSLGSQVTVGKMSLQNVDGKLYYVAPLEHTSLLKWLFNGGTPGYVMVSATDVDNVELITELDGKEMKIKYLESAYLLSNIRIATFLRDLRKGHDDYTFEIDDDGNPYWVVTRYDTGVGITEQSAIGVTIIDAQTGESNIYSKEELPEWVDRVEPMDNIDRYLRKWGELVHGVLNFTDKDKLTTTYGMSIIYNKGECYYFTGITSVGNDESLVGFTLTNTVTRETTMYRTSGATELAAMESAEGKVQQYGYKATLPYLLNIDGQPTYFLTLKDASGLVKQYAMVNVSSYSNVAVGSTLKEALLEYRKTMSLSDISLSGSDTAEKEIVTGKVTRIGLVISDEMTYYDMVLENDARYYTVSTGVSREAALTAAGDTVEITILSGAEGEYITALGFDNLTIGEN